MGVRDLIARAVIRRVKVYRIDNFSIEPPEIVRLPERVETHREIPEVKAEVSRPFNLEEMKGKITCRTVKVSLEVKGVKAKNQGVKRWVKEDVKSYRVKLAERVKTWPMLKNIQALPQVRENMLKYMKTRPDTAKGEVLLACYGPIVEGAVLKLALDKQRGTLLIWYKPGSRQLKAKNVYLIRRLGLGAKPEWRWM